jgi:hypothetical protein
MNLFDMHSRALAYLVLAFVQLAHEGLGRSRGRADLRKVWQLDAGGECVARLCDGEEFLLSDGPAPMTLSLAPRAERVERVRVRFVTPTELKSGQ